jgi:FkbM family methyltransferase
VRLVVDAGLARLLLHFGDKPRGLRRLPAKLVKATFFLVHRRLGVTAKGRLVIDGHGTVAVDLANTAFLALARENAADREVAMLLDLLAPTARIVYDIGANFGYFTLLLTTHPRFRGHIHAFEIKPATFADLARCVGGAALGDTVTPHPFGLSDRDGTVWISAERHSLLTRVLGADDASGAAESVAVRRLDALGLPPPDLIKIDVEGHEAAVFRGALATLRAAAPFIVFENWFDRATAKPMVEPLELLAGEGYRFCSLRIVDENFLSEPITIAERATIPHSLNLLAVHPSRENQLRAAFAGGHGGPR